MIADLASHGHRFIERERGSTDTKLWKDVKRKRVRIPDLLCLNCGTRIECRAKTDLELAMSHSPTDAERAWDFGMVDASLREEAIDGLVAIGGTALPSLLQGLRDADESMAAGCAEVLRRAEPLPANVLKELAKELASEQPKQWAVWLVGHLPREHFAAAIAELQHRKPELHYAVSLLWSFVESWISRNWELRPTPHFPGQ